MFAVPWNTLFCFGVAWLAVWDGYVDHVYLWFCDVDADPFYHFGYVGDGSFVAVVIDEGLYGCWDFVRLLSSLGGGVIRLRAMPRGYFSGKGVVAMRFFSVL